MKSIRKQARECGWDFNYEPVFAKSKGSERWAKNSANKAAVEDALSDLRDRLDQHRPDQIVVSGLFTARQLQRAYRGCQRTDSTLKECHESSSQRTRPMTLCTHYGWTAEVELIADIGFWGERSVRSTELPDHYWSIVMNRIIEILRRPPARPEAEEETAEL